MRYYHRNKIKCSVCGKEDEGYLLEIDLWIFTLERGLCESCISKMFKGLKRNLKR